MYIPTYTYMYTYIPYGCEVKIACEYEGDRMRVGRVPDLVLGGHTAMILIEVILNEHHLGGWLRQTLSAPCHA